MSKEKIYYSGSIFKINNIKHMLITDNFTLDILCIDKSQKIGRVIHKDIPTLEGHVGVTKQILEEYLTWYFSNKQFTLKI